MVRSEILAATERSYPSVRLVTLARKSPDPTAPGPAQAFLVESYSLFCRHSVRQDIIFRIDDFFEGWSEYPNLRAEAEDFFRGVQVRRR